MSEPSDMEAKSKLEELQEQTRALEKDLAIQSHEKALKEFFKKNIGKILKEGQCKVNLGLVSRLHKINGGATDDTRDFVNRVFEEVVIDHLHSVLGLQGDYFLEDGLRSMQEELDVWEDDTHKKEAEESEKKHQRNLEMAERKARKEAEAAEKKARRDAEMAERKARRDAEIAQQKLKREAEFAEKKRQREAKRESSVVQRKRIRSADECDIGTRNTVENRVPTYQPFEYLPYQERENEYM